MKYISLLFIVVFIACVQKKKETVQPIDTSTLLQQSQAQQPQGQHQVKVEEVLQTSSYTYLKVAENGKNYWMAVVRTDAKVGDNYYYAEGLEMKDFKSKELDRVFEKVFFVDKISSTQVGSGSEKQLKDAHSSRKSTETKQDIQIEVPEGGITIGELFANREKYNSKSVLIKGKVVKVNKAIMSRNWVHLQDGTNSDGKFDLTLTTNEEVKLGDTVIMEGIVTLNKDFGSGYFYELIVEEAKVK